MKQFLMSAAMILAALPASAAQWEIVPEESHLRFSGTHMGRGFSGEFGQWSGSIDYDPEAPEAMKVKVTVQTGSATTGDATYDATLPKEDWFNAEAMPEAVFESSRVEVDDRGIHTVDGDLSIRGTDMQVMLQGPLTVEGDTATFEAKSLVNRMDYDIGKESDASGEWVSLQIPLEITVVARRVADAPSAD
jgi:cytochrome b561